MGKDGNRYELIRGTLVPKEHAGKTLMTAEELLRLPRGQGRRYELIRGVLVEKMPTGNPHADTTSLAAYFLTHYTFETGNGETRTGEPGFRLEDEPDTVRAPDVAWISPGRIPENTQGYPELAPDLAVEVKSPSNSNPEMGEKASMWLAYGSRQVWILDPEHITVTVRRLNSEPIVLSENDLLDGGELLPEFSVEVWRLFRRER
jgi:Uma2 family endonuclease